MIYKCPDGELGRGKVNNVKNNPHLSCNWAHG